MRHLNWLVKIILYNHKEHKATKDTTGSGIFYDIGFIDQLHANLCTDASINMLYHFAGKPIASMTKNIRGTFEGTQSNENFSVKPISIDSLRNQLEEHGPFILALPLKYKILHSVVVIGFDDNNKNIIYHDPLTGSNKKLSLTELKKINANNIVEISAPNFYLDNITTKKTTKIFEHPKNIAIKKHQRFFTINKMENEDAQCKAVKDFLRDYTKNSFWTKRHHIQKVSDFLDTNKDINNIEDLLSNMNKDLGQDMKMSPGELQTRIQVIKHVFNKEKSAEVDGYKSTLR